MEIAGTTTIKHAGLWRALQRLGWSQADLARASGLRQTDICTVVNMKRRPPEKMRLAIESSLAKQGIGIDLFEDWPEDFKGFGRTRRVTNFVIVEDRQLIDEASLRLPPPQMEHMEGKELADTVAECLDSLTPRQREAIDLRFFEGKTYEEAGRIMGLSRERVRQLEDQGLKALRRPGLRRRLLEVLP